MELKKNKVIYVLENEEVNRKFFKAIKRTKTDKIRKQPLKGGIIKTYKLDMIEGISYSTLPYEELIDNLIRKKYTINEELAIQRQRDTKPDEFKEYFDCVENIKTQVKDFILERETYFDEKGNLKVIE